MERFIILFSPFIHGLSFMPIGVTNETKVNAK